MRKALLTLLTSTLIFWSVSAPAFAKKEEFQEFAFIKRVSRLLELKLRKTQAVVTVEHVVLGSDRPEFKPADRQSVEQVRDLWALEKRRWWLKRSERLSIR